MFRDMTLGQYYRADSVIHRLDPRVKLLGTLLFVVTLFFPKSIWGVLCSSAFLFGVILVSKVPFSMVIRGVKPLLFIIIFSAVINMFSTAGKDLAVIGPFHLTYEGLWMAIYLVIRLVYLIVGSAIMTFTTTPNQLTQGLEKAFGFLKKVNVPVHEFAMMMSIALRFIPILTEELDKIMKAQMSRGADFESGNVIKKGMQFIPILVPLFIAAIRRASDLALAMDARCYHGGENRTQLHPLEYQKSDYAGYGVMVAYVVVMLVISILTKVM